ncbi:MAG TPA: hypothetical protein VGD08_03305 [Stellaceae bacterium]
MMTNRVLPAALVAVPLLLPGIPAGAQSERQPAEPAPAPAAGTDDAAQQDAGSGRGPIVGGRYRQPTQAEIDARLRRPEERAGRNANKEVEDLYGEALRLSTPKRE